jgi:nitronate monooxygenase
MPLPALFQQALRVPVIGAPMFLVSFPTLVKALCKAGVVGTFPHVNARPSQQLDAWLSDIAMDLAAHRAAHPHRRVETPHPRRHLNLTLPNSPPHAFTERRFSPSTFI